MIRKSDSLKVAGCAKATVEKKQKDKPFDLSFF
jgi:hypothetical protein